MKKWLSAIAIAFFLPLVFSGLFAYTPGTGNVFTENFNDQNDDGWDSWLSGAVSKWYVLTSNVGWAYAADGCADMGKPTLHASSRKTHRVPAIGASVAFYQRSAGTSNAYFYIDLEQQGRIEQQPKLIR